MDMGVRDIGADDFPKGAGAESLFHVAAEFFDGMHQGVVILVLEIVDFIDFYFRNDESVALRFGVDVEEGEGSRILVDFVTGYFTVYYLCEDAWHFYYSF